MTGKKTRWKVLDGTMRDETMRGQGKKVSER